MGGVEGESEGRPAGDRNARASNHDVSSLDFLPGSYAALPQHVASGCGSIEPAAPARRRSRCAHSPCPAADYIHSLHDYDGSQQHPRRGALASNPSLRMARSADGPQAFMPRAIPRLRVCNPLASPGQVRAVDDLCILVFKNTFALQVLPPKNLGFVARPSPATPRLSPSAPTRPHPPLSARQAMLSTPTIL